MREREKKPTKNKHSSSTEETWKCDGGIIDITDFIPGFYESLDFLMWIAFPFSERKILFDHLARKKTTLDGM